MDLIPTYVPIDTLPSNSVKYIDTSTTEGVTYMYLI